MTTLEVYKKYNIQPNLQTHMLRVAWVAEVIVDNLKDVSVNKDNVICACLLHDMGNIIKFNLKLFPQFLEPEGYDYWLNVQTEYKNKYGNDEHIATYKIAKEVGVTDDVFDLINAIGFSNSKQNYESHDIAKKICAYSDFRVTPYGVTSLKLRLEDGNKRFKINRPEKHDEKVFKINSNYINKIQDQLFSLSKITPEDITDEAVDFEKFKNFVIN